MLPTTAPGIGKKITRLYLLALTAVALLTVGGQFLVQQSLKRQLSDSRVINMAGRQRMLSQKICKTVLLLAQPAAPGQALVQLAQLKDALTHWQQSHVGLKKGYLAQIRTPVNNSDTIQYMFDVMEPHFLAIYHHARAVEQILRAPIPDPAAVKPHLRVILKHEPLFLQSMERIVFRYDAEAIERINNSQKTERYLLLVTLLILLLEGFFVFRPAVNQIRRTIGLLIQAQYETQVANEELLVVNHSLKETKEALLHATRRQYEQEIKTQKLRSAYLIEGQDEERKRVAREIHDGLGQMLTALKYGIEKIRNEAGGAAPAQANLDEVRHLVSQTISEARAIAFNLMPAVLSDFGLASALKLLTNQVAGSAGIQVDYQSDWNGRRLPKNVEIGLYRVSQEALHNAIKYAGAKEIKVILTRRKKHLHLTISDNGRGFRHKPGAGPSGKAGAANGIRNMKERIFLIDGKIAITSKPEKGTRIEIVVPLHKTDYGNN